MVFSGIISEDFDSNVSWTLTVGGQTFTGTGTSVSATWYGQDAFGRIVSPGNYTAMVSATDDGGCTAVSSVTIQVIAPPPSDNTSSTNSSDNTNDTPSLEVCAGSTNNVANGTLSHQQSLFSTKGISLATDMQLNYSSSDSYDGPLGLGWSHSYDMRLSFNSDGSAVLREGNGVKRYYTISGSGYVSQTGDTSSLRNVGGTYQVTFRDGRKYTFNQDGRIAAITDRYNNSIVFAYSNGDLITITDPAGRTTTLGYDPAKPHRINSVADPNNNVYNFTYQGDSLWQVINPAADPAASPERGYWEYIYYTDGYRKGYLQSKRDPNGNITQYDYDSNHRLLSAIDPEGAATSVGHTRSFQYQMDSGYTTKLTDKDGGAWSYTYDPNTGVLTRKSTPTTKRQPIPMIRTITSNPSPDLATASRKRPDCCSPHFIVTTITGT